MAVEGALTVRLQSALGMPRSRVRSEESASTDARYGSFRVQIVTLVDDTSPSLTRAGPLRSGVDHGSTFPDQRSARSSRAALPQRSAGPDPRCGGYSGPEAALNVLGRRCRFHFGTSVWRSARFHSGTSVGGDPLRAGTDHACARFVKRSSSLPASITTVSPGTNSPLRIRSASGSCTYRWMARFNGRATYTGSYPRSARKLLAASVSSRSIRFSARSL